MLFLLLGRADPEKLFLLLGSADPEVEAAELFLLCRSAAPEMDEEAEREEEGV